MAEKPFNKITIRELTDDCGVNRQTFYYHFTDIVDLLEWMYHEETLGLISQFEGDPLSWKQAILVIMQYVQENAPVCLCALKSIGNKQLRNFFYEDFKQLYQNVFDFITRDMNVDQDFKEFISDLYVFGAEGMMIHWLESGMKESPEQIAEWLSIYLEGNVRSIFERYADYKRKKLAEKPD